MQCWSAKKQWNALSSLPHSIQEVTVIKHRQAAAVGVVRLLGRILGSTLPLAQTVRHFICPGGLRRFEDKGALPLQHTNKLRLANGSCRKPAYWNGCYAVRPTHGVISTDGVASFCP